MSNKNINNLKILFDDISNTTPTKAMTLADINGLKFAFDDLYKYGIAQTIQKGVADFFKKYSFVKVATYGVGWFITL